jgi:hypothetical protein
MKKIINFQHKDEFFDVNKLPYKYAIQEHLPLKLSNKMWLHSYRVTNYNDQSQTGDIDVEEDCFNNEMYG